MGEHVEFPGGNGYLATPDHGSAGPALIVLGSGPGIDRGAIAACDRFAAEGFTALALEAAHGDADPVTIDGPGGADQGPAIAFLEDHPMVHGKGVGILGFGEGAMLAMASARFAPDDVKACVPFYGSPPVGEYWTGSHVPVQGHFSGRDGAVTPEDIQAFEARLRDARRPVEVFVYDAGPGFFDETSSTHDAEAAHEAFIRALSFLRARLG